MFLIGSLFDSEPAGSAFPHEQFLFWLFLGLWLRRCIINRECSFHDGEHVSFLFSNLHKVFVAFVVVPLCFEFVTFSLISALFTLSVCMLLMVYSIILKFFTKVVRGIGSSFRGHSLTCFCSEGDGVIIFEDTFAMLLDRFGCVIDLLLLILLLLLNIS